MLMVELLFQAGLHAQSTQLVTHTFPVDSQSIRFDSVSVVEGSISVFFLNRGSWREATTESYSIAHYEATLNIRKSPLPDSVRITYQRYPFNLGKTFFHKDPLALEMADLDLTPYEIKTGNTVSFDELDQLQYNGSLVRGLSFGNNQDVVVNSSFNLQMNGTLRNDVEVTAAITDNNIPIQPDGNTQQLQEFDKVFIRLSKNEHALTVGDFDLLRPKDYFLNYYKRTQGLSYQGAFKDNKGGRFRTSTSAAVVRGLYTRQFLEVIEGNQGPYKLRGNNGETFIIVLAGTERVWLDGILLTRGAENDYVIDYNAGEITFTPNQLVNKDKRIQIEFEYADNSYFRSIVTTSNTYTSADEKLEVRLNIYSEQDSKNQPLDQELDSISISALSNPGDSILQAFVPGFDTISFDPDRILYRLTDSLGFDSVFVYSNDPETANYTVSFTELGPNKGNYRLSTTLANGRVYEWVAPVAGVPQGSAEPIVLLTAPISRRMITAGADYSLNEHHSVTGQIAHSQNDQNTFADAGNADNDGLGIMTGHKFSKKLTSGLNLSSEINYERIGKDFRFIERYRPVEFNRDWNLSDEQLTPEHYTNATLKLQSGKDWTLLLNSSSFIREEAYRGFKQAGNFVLNNDNWRIRTGGSYLDAATDTTSVTFFRPDASIARMLGKGKGFELGGRYLGEHNRILEGDSLINGSFYFDEFVLFARTADTSRLPLQTDLIFRNDGLPLDGKFKLANQGYTLNMRGNTGGASRNRLSWVLTYRSLDVIDTSLSNQLNENAILGRLQHSLVAGKGWLTSDIFMEVGTGQEPKREFTFVEVEPGQGTHSWIDYNENGIQELNEFELAVFADQATFIQVFIPTDEYIQANTSQFNYVLGLNPKSVWFDSEGVKEFAAKFSSLSTLQLNRKVLDDKSIAAYLPVGEVPDSQLVSSNVYWQNTVYFNRSQPVFGVDYTYQRTLGKVVLVNGPEAREKAEHRVNMRYRIIEPLTFTLLGASGIKRLASIAFTDRSYRTPYTSLEPGLTFLKGTSFRISTKYIYKISNNTEGGEQLISHTGVADIRYNVPGNSSVTARFSFTDVAFEGVADSPVGFAMLEGLQNGANILWNLKYDKRLSKVLQLTLSYDGRKTGTAAIVHLGSVQMRAFF